MKNDFQKFLIRIAKLLDKLGIRYFITGGFAVSVWGRVRATFDIDVVVQMASPDVTRLAKELRILGKTMYVDEDMMRNALGTHGEFNIIHAESGVKIDFWILSNDESSRRELARRKVKFIGDQRVYFISPEDLILSKLRWVKKGATDYHLDDARSVVRKMGTALDGPYIKKEAQAQSTNDLLKNIF